MDEVFYWKGEPVADLPRETLIEIIIQIGQENAELRAENMRRSIEHISDLGRMASARRSR